MRVRSVQHPQDLPALRDLFKRSAAGNGYRSLSEHKLRALVGRQLVGEGLVLDQDGGIEGYLHMLESRIAGVFELEVVALDVGETSTVSALLSAALGQLRDIGASSVIAWLYGSAEAQVLRKHGFELQRSLHQLRVPLPIAELSSTPALDVRSFEPADEPNFLSLSNRAFEGHPETGNWDVEELRRRQTYDWYDQTGIRMGWSDGRLVAFCWTKSHPAGLGEIYLIASDPECRGCGFGRAIALEGLRYLWSERGATEGMLYVDSSNLGAVRLYRHLGFNTHHTDRAYILRL